MTGNSLPPPEHGASLLTTRNLSDFFFLNEDLCFLCFLFGIHKDLNVLFYYSQCYKAKAVDLMDLYTWENHKAWLNEGLWKVLTGLGHITRLSSLIFS